MERACEKCDGTNPAEAAYCAQCGADLSPQSEDDAALGTMVLDRYRLIGVLGEGAMGRVYEAEQQMGGVQRRVAIKALHANLTKDATLAERFRRECEVVVQLEHPNTIKFLDFGTLSDGRLAIVMEYVDGDTLADRLKRGPLPIDRVEWIVGQVCGSLHEAHQLGIVHRDLKPDNVMLTQRAGQSDVVKVCDFGIAHTGDGDGRQLTMQGAVLGTPPYMSPEQFGSAPLDSRSDVYSLGVMVYEMLSGELPFRASNVFEWAQCHLRQAPTPLASQASAGHVSAAQRDVVMRALAKDPAARPASVREFARQFSTAEKLPTGWGLGSAHGLPAPRGIGPTAAMPTSSPGLPPDPAAFHPATPYSPPPASHHGARSVASASGWTNSEAGVLSSPPSNRLGLWIGGAVLALGALVLLGGGFLYVLIDDPDETDEVEPEAHEPHEPVVTPEPVRFPDTGVAAPVVLHHEEPVSPTIDPPPSDWLRIVHFQERVDEATNAVGPPDDRYAILRPGARLTLELVPGQLVRSDRGPGPDLYVRVDDARSGPYGVDVGQGHHGLRVVAHALSGSLPLDLDQYRVRQARYVRITNSTERLVYLDAVGVYGAQGAEHQHH